jgi:ferritin-like protein
VLARLLQRAASMSEYHEPVEELDDRVRDMHRALVSLTEELEAADWYAQRVARCADADLRRILTHNMNEEMEHAAMLIEWLRRVSPEWDVRLRKVLFTTAPLGFELDEKGAPGDAALAAGGPGLGLGLGSLKRSVP